ncbi:hypothetical protein E4U54_004582 [Claviceps lovelessii]|nr:hypothetical protein E4U54_004582 [Claviceps lovelessii]
MGSFTFKWADPTTDPSDVLVTGSFDGWTKSVTLEKDGGVFQKTVKISEEDAANKIYYKFVVDNTWVINESYPHEPDHQGNVNNFLTADDLVKPTPAQDPGLVPDPLINTVTPESTTVTEMGKKNNNNKKNKADKMSAAEVNTPEAAPTAVASNPSPELADTKEAMATPSDVPGGFPATPSNGDGTPSTEAADLENKSVSIDPLPATAGLGNPIKLAPGEKIPESITAQNVDDQVKLDKESYEKSDAYPTAPAPASEVSPVSGTVIPESSVPVTDTSDVTNVAINSVGPESTTVALAGQVPLVSEQSAVPDVVKESQDEAGVSTETSAVPAEVEDNAEVEAETDNVVPEASAATVGTAGDDAEKEKEKSSEGDVVAAAAVQDAPAAEKTEASAEDVSPQVPKEVKESIAAADESPEAAVSDSAVKNKEAVESALLEEVAEAPAISDASESAVAAAKPDDTTQTATVTEEPVDQQTIDEEPVEEKPADLKPVEEPVEEKPVEEKPIEEKPVEEPVEKSPVEEEKPVEEQPVEEIPAEEKPVEEIPAEEKPVEETPAEEKPVEETPAEEKPAEEKPGEETPVEEPVETQPAAAATTSTDDAATAPAAEEAETNTTEPPTAADVTENANDDAAISESTPAEGSTGDKKKNRFSVMFDKIKAKLK